MIADRRTRQRSRRSLKPIREGRGSRRRVCRLPGRKASASRRPFRAEKEHVRGTGTLRRVRAAGRGRCSGYTARCCRRRRIRRVRFRSNGACRSRVRASRRRPRPEGPPHGGNGCSTRVPCGPSLPRICTSATPKPSPPSQKDRRRAAAAIWTFSISSTLPRFRIRRGSRSTARHPSGPCRRRPRNVR